MNIQFSLFYVLITTTPQVWSQLSPPVISEFMFGSSSGHTVAVPGDPIRCYPRLTGTPPPTPTFYKDDAPFPNQPDMGWTELQASLDDAGSYYIIANNSQGAAISPTITLSIVYVEPWADSGEVETLTVRAGNPLIIEVPPLDAYPATTDDTLLKWINANTNNVITRTGNYHVTLGDQRLLILDTPAQFNNLMVRARYSSLLTQSTTLSRKFLIRVTDNSLSSVAPTLVVPLPSVTKVANFESNRVLECVINARPIANLQIKWYKIPAGGSVTQEQSVTGRRLSLPTITKLMDGDKFECRSEMAGFDAVTSTTTLHVLDKPLYQTHISNRYNEDLGATVTFSCEVSGEPTPAIAWYKNGIPINSGQRMVISTNGSLTLYNLELSDRAVYQIRAYNELGEIWAQTYLSIISSAPDITSPPTDVTKIAGNDAILACEVTGKPVPAVSWHFESSLSPGSSIEITDSGRFRISDDSLTISTTQSTDSGTYTCRASNSLGTEEASATLIVYNRTTIQGDSTSMEEEKGATVTRECRLNKDSRVSATITWFQNGAPLDLNGRTLTNNNQVLTFTSLRSLTDQGVFRCDVSSLAGDASQSHNITIKEVPVRPEVQAVNHPSINRAIKLTWRTPFNGNRPLMHYILQQKIVEPNANWLVISREIPADAQIWDVTGLKPAKTYQYTLKAVNDYGEGQESVPTDPVRIEPEPPSAPPSNVQLAPLTTTSIQVQWYPPPENERNGEITGYVIQYSLAGGSSTPRQVAYDQAIDGLMSHDLGNLQVYSDYIVQVAAQNEKGVGVYSTSDRRIRTQEGRPTQAPQITSAVADSSTSIVVEWDRPHDLSINGLTRGFRIQAYRVGSTQAINKTVASTVQTARIENLEKYTNYSIHVTLFTDGGSSPEDVVISSTLQDRPGPVTNVTVTTYTHHSFSLAWSPPTVRNGILTAYNISISGNGIDRTYTVNHPNTTLFVDGLMPESRYTITIYASTVVGFGLVSYTTSITTRPPPVAPQAPRSLTVIPAEVQARSLVLSFIPGYDGQAPVEVWLIQGQIEGESNWVNFTAVMNQPDATRVEVTGLQPYTSYYFRMVATNIAGPSPYSNATRTPSRTHAAKPEFPPRSVSARAQNYSTLIVNWDPLPLKSFNGDARGYFIEYFSDFDTTDRKSKSVENHAERFTILSGLNAYTFYTIVVTARNANFSSDPSDPARAETIEHVPSASPPGLQASADSATQVTVTWMQLDTVNKNGVITGYRVFYTPADSLSDSTTTQTKDVDPAVYTCTLTELDAFTEYSIQVLAYTRFGLGPISAPVTVTTQSTRPATPIDLSVTDLRENRLTLSWRLADRPGAPGPFQYILTYRGTNSDSSQRNHSLTSTSYQLSDLVSDTRYRVELRCYSTGNSQSSDTVSMEVQTVPSGQQSLPTSPTEFQIESFTSRNAALRWNHQNINNQLPVRSFILYLRDDSSAYEPYAVIPGNTMRYTVEGLHPDIKYYLKLYASNDKGQSLASPEKWFTTAQESPSTPPSDLEIIPKTADSLQLNWVIPPENEWNGQITHTMIWYSQYQPPFTPQWSSINESFPAVTYRLSDLVPNRHYEVALSVVNSQGSGPRGIPQVIYVGVAVPIGSPSEVNSSMKSATELTVTWKPVQKAEINGQLLGYKVYYTMITPRTRRAVPETQYDLVGPEETSHVITGLEIYTEYQVEVTAYNIAGEGPRSDGVVVITDQGHPEAPVELRISEITLTIVNVTWKEPIKLNGNITHYVLTAYNPYTTESSTHTEFFIKAPQTYKIVDLNKVNRNSTFTFSVRAKTETNLEGDESKKNYTTGPHPGVPGAPNEATYTLEDTGITFKWTVNDQGSSAIIGYVIEGLLDSGWSLVKRAEESTNSVFISNVELPTGIISNKYQLSAFNTQGLGEPTECTLLTTFYKSWWFLVIVALVGFIIIITIISVLCCYCYRMRVRRKYQYSTNRGRLVNHTKMAEEAYEQDVLGGVDHEGGGFSTFEMRVQSFRRNGARGSKYKEPPRPSPGAVLYQADEKPPSYTGYGDDSSVTDKQDFSSDEDEKANMSATDSSDDDIDKGSSTAPSYNHYQYGGYRSNNHYNPNRAGPSGAGPSGASAAVQQSWQNSFGRARAAPNMYSYTDSEAESTVAPSSSHYRPSLNYQANGRGRGYNQSNGSISQSNSRDHLVLQTPPSNVSSFI